MKGKRKAAIAWKVRRIVSRERSNALFREGLISADRRWPNIVKALQTTFAFFARRQNPYVDLTGYHKFLPELLRREVFQRAGDILEVGAFVGVGTAKLAAVAKGYGKRVYAIDLFERGSDATRCISGVAMDEVYDGVLKGADQWAAYQRNTAPVAETIETIRGDSARLSLPTNLRLCFAFIDGNHDPAYVRSDFRLAWSRLVPGGVVGFDDYGFDLPQVTEAVDRIMAAHEPEIQGVLKVPPKMIFLWKHDPASGAGW